MQATFSSGRYVLDQDAVAELEEEEKKGTQASKTEQELRYLKKSGSTSRAYAVMRQKEEKERMEKERREQEIEMKQKEERAR